jgi:hypothetical protein
MCVRIRSRGPSQNSTIVRRPQASSPHVRVLVGRRESGDLSLKKTQFAACAEPGRTLGLPAFLLLPEPGRNEIAALLVLIYFSPTQRNTQGWNSDS